MTVPDAASDDRASRRRIHPDHLCAVLATPVAAVAVALWVVDIANGQPTLVPGVTIALWVAAAVLVLAWLVTSFERRLSVRINRIEDARYRAGYADGYIDATNRRDDGGYERPTLRPVK
jgi:hypothetical protein